jgi:hypothetical protein
MEDPIRFDLFIKVDRGHNEEIFSWLKTNLSEIEARKAINLASVSGDWLLVAKANTWSEINTLRKNLPEWCNNAAVYQQSWRPDEFTYFCEKHNLHYGGCLGCHVCTGFYQP